MYIDWQLSDVCNFKCTYCNLASMGGVEGWPTLEQAKGLVDNILSHSDHDYRTYNLLGGEPTLWKHFGELCTYIHNEDESHVIQVLTNGSRTKRWWQTYAPTMDKIIISHHVATTKDRSPEHTIMVAETCHPNSNVSIQILMDIDNFDECATHFNVMLARLPGIRITPKKGETNLGSGEWMPYSPEQLAWFDDALVRAKANEQRISPIHKAIGNKPIDRRFFASDGVTEWHTSNKDLIINDANHFEGWNCNIGLDMIAVKPSGQIRPSSSCFKNVTLGNYRTSSTINWPKAPFVCNQASCFCGADIEVEKHAPK
jgi:MoaA/NifB/PqqE/SkfB family radical SAM enzyme